MRLAHSGNFDPGNNKMPSLKKLNKHTMNKLFHAITWGNYLETLALVAIAYYAWIGWAYYRADIQKLIARLRGEDPDEHTLPEALRYPEEQERPGHLNIIMDGPDASHSQSAHEYEGTEHNSNPALQALRQQLSACIRSVADKPFAPAVLIPKLKKILNDYPDIAATPERELINGYIVRECEETGTALLSDSEVDSWWSA